MKRIQMFKASVIVVAIGGAFASKASTRQVVTRFTINGTGTPCNTPSRGCNGFGKICRDGVVPNVKTYYHQLGSNPCGQVLMEQP